MYDQSIQQNMYWNFEKIFTAGQPKQYVSLVYNNLSIASLYPQNTHNFENKIA